MKRYALLSCVVFCLVISGCARDLPDREAGYGMVAVPFKVNNTSGLSLLYTIELRSSEDETFSILIEPQFYKDDVVMSKLLPEGDYTVDTMIMQFVKEVGVTGDTSRDTIAIADPLVITVKDGEIGVLPSLMVAKQTIIGERISIDFEYVPFNDELADFYIKRTRQRENSDQWEVDILRIKYL